RRSERGCAGTWSPPLGVVGVGTSDVQSVPAKHGRGLALRQAPFATGRDGSEDHSLHEPGYSVVVPSPAISIASTLWQAVAPEPHWCTTCCGARPATNAWNSARNCSG